MIWMANKAMIATRKPSFFNDSSTKNDKPYSTNPMKVKKNVKATLKPSLMSIAHVKWFISAVVVMTILLMIST